MKYITSKHLDTMSDNELIYVNRNIFNLTLAEYEIKVEQLQCENELETLLKLWKNVYNQEMKNKRIEPFVVMSNKEVKRCFKNYKNFPVGSFCCAQNNI